MAISGYIYRSEPPEAAIQAPIEDGAFVRVVDFDPVYPEGLFWFI